MSKEKNIVALYLVFVKMFKRSKVIEPLQLLPRSK